MEAEVHTESNVNFSIARMHQLLKGHIVPMSPLVFVSFQQNVAFTM